MESIRQSKHFRAEQDLSGRNGSAPNVFVELIERSGIGTPLEDENRIRQAEVQVSLECQAIYDLDSLVALFVASAAPLKACNQKTVVDRLWPLELLVGSPT